MHGQIWKPDIRVLDCISGPVLISFCLTSCGGARQPSPRPVAVRPGNCLRMGTRENRDPILKPGGANLSKNILSPPPFHPKPIKPPPILTARVLCEAIPESVANPGQRLITKFDLYKEGERQSPQNERPPQRAPNGSLLNRGRGSLRGGGEVRNISTKT